MALFQQILSLQKYPKGKWYREKDAGFVKQCLYFSSVWPFQPVEDGGARVIRGESVRDRLTVRSVNASNLVPLKSPNLVSLAGQEREGDRESESGWYAGGEAWKGFIGSNYSR